VIHGFTYHHTPPTVKNIFGLAGTSEGLLMYPSQIAIDDQGRLLIKDAGRIQLFSNIGEFQNVVAKFKGNLEMVAYGNSILLADAKSVKLFGYDDMVPGFVVHDELQDLYYSDGLSKNNSLHIARDPHSKKLFISDPSLNKITVADPIS